MRLIDANELEARLRMQPNNLSKISVIDMVHASPTIEERKTGRWIDVGGARGLIPSNDFKCSVCGNFLDFNGVNAGRGDANYCPNCGAKMEGAEE